MRARIGIIGAMAGLLAAFLPLAGQAADLISTAAAPSTPTVHSDLARVPAPIRPPADAAMKPQLAIAKKRVESAFRSLADDFNQGDAGPDEIPWDESQREAPRQPQAPAQPPAADEPQNQPAQVVELPDHYPTEEEPRIVPQEPAYPDEAAAARSAPATARPEDSSSRERSAWSPRNWGLAKENHIANGDDDSDAYASGVDATDAWSLGRGSRKVVVAVVDTGVDVRHPDLSGNIWHNASGVYGWDFVSNRPNPRDVNGHGTHVAGILGALYDPDHGVSGVAQAVSIMAVKYYSDSNPGWLNTSNSVKALNYAVDHGAKIINYSGGGPEFVEDEYLALKKAEARGVLVVAAAGNDGKNTDIPQNYYYPAAYRLPNIISVAGTDVQDRLVPTSDWGRSSVDVAAPGENIYSTLPGGQYGYMTGTSQATPFVTGIATLLLAQDPGLTPAQIKQIILDTADRLPQLSGAVANGGRVNAYAALERLEELLHGGQPPHDLMPENGVPSQIFR